MPELVLGPLLRYVDETSATIWVEVDKPASVSVLDHRAKTFTIAGRHFALVIVDGLRPGTSTTYTVELDGREVWPEAGSRLPPSLIRTSNADAPTSVLLGSCRAAAPHEPPYTLELMTDPDGRGIDTLWAHGRRMLHEQPGEWPDLLLLLGDQIYADDSSPGAKERIERRREDSDLPPEIVADFEEYCWLYHEAWSASVERWLLSTVPSAMIFDDHDNIDDWNISASWVSDIREEPWWSEHSIGSLMSYWIYQHLGNLSPAQICREGMLAELVAAEDGTDLLRRWALDVEAATPRPGGYRFSFARTVGDVTVVVIDSRNGRVLTAGQRLMVGPDEWEWIGEKARSVNGHLILASSLPVFLDDGLHDLQVWNEHVAGGAWGARAAGVAEKIRRSLDLEDWPAFGTSYRLFVDLVTELRSAESPPRSIVVASGDIHFSYAARVPIAEAGAGPEVWQVVSSPIRNALIPPEQGVMRSTLTAAGRRFGGLLRRLSRAPRSRPGIEMEAGPFFANNMAEIHYRGDEVRLLIEQSTPDDDGNPQLETVAELMIGPGARKVEVEAVARWHRRGSG